MSFSINVNISPRMAAKLMIANEIDSDAVIENKDSKLILEAMADLTVDEILRVVDFSASQSSINVGNIPQFGNREAVKETPFILCSRGSCGINYAQLGYKLKKDINASAEANTKYGENHGKAAVILGIAKGERGKFYCTPMGEGFMQMEEETKERLLTFLYFRIPIVQNILKIAKNGTVNGYDLMFDMTKSTKARRGQCLRGIFKYMTSLDNHDLNQRIDNIIWEME